ncbi:TetR/AcrR family transcriptional regulator [Thauera linaloolentis]|uniref:TetR family transcriptional regulator n=1 Tax=Thauera linaloolentis (strain DSM 12138 / JCM 21573 / CCUG 41526 / CIP 105981 / IAM 15112 / NBRC 102519 / 47Lol) TaxID=1123367 RepID=N6Y2C2_THAL4|nr:TetR/AcrR family transcriptional regulator [Thauera linaloolentis]ENO85695.1 TetR family transcriptional regulator [Thauera linaloolentis 47Lol = DSM 12138]MCM8566682.1 TetR/AcrR family transcriptional regulator [Thauera linaloolentis]
MTTSIRKPMKRLSREESQLKTREDLIATATRLFTEKGYGGTSIRDIADQAGYSQGAFYSNYESKEALLLEMLRRHMQREAEKLIELVAQDPGNTEDVLAALEAWATTLDQDVNWSMLSIELQLHAQRSETFAIQYREVFQQHQQVLARWMDKLFVLNGRQTPASTQDIASAFMALAHGLSLQHAAIGAGAPASVLVLLLRGLLALGKPTREIQGHSHRHGLHGR